MKKQKTLYYQVIMYIIMMFTMLGAISAYTYDIQPDDIYRPIWENWWQYPDTYGSGSQMSLKRNIPDIDLDGVNETIELCTQFDSDCPTARECGNGDGSFKLTMSNSTDTYFHFYGADNITPNCCFSPCVIQGQNVPIISDDLGGIIGYASIDTTFTGAYIVPLGQAVNITFTTYPYFVPSEDLFLTNTTEAHNVTFTTQWGTTSSTNGFRIRTDKHYYQITGSTRQTASCNGNLILRHDNGSIILEGTQLNNLSDPYTVLQPNTYYRIEVRGTNQCMYGTGTFPYNDTYIQWVENSFNGGDLQTGNGYYASILSLDFKIFDTNEYACLDNGEDCVFTSNVTFTKNHTSNGTITLQDNVTFDGAGYTLMRYDQTGNLMYMNGSNIILKNLIIDSNGTDGSIEVYGGVENITIQKNNFTVEASNFITVNADVDRLNIESNRIQTTFGAIFISGEDYSSEETIIQDNIILGNTSTGTHLIRMTGIDGLLYKNNTIRYTATNDYGHLYLESIKNALFIDNNHTTNRNAGIDLYNGDPLINVTISDSIMDGGIEDEKGGTGNTDHTVIFNNISFDGDSAFDKGNYTFIKSTFGTNNEMTLNTATQLNASYDTIKELDILFFFVTRPLLVHTDEVHLSLNIDTYMTATQVDTSLDMTDTYVSIIDSSFLDYPASITFDNVGSHDVPYRDGIICADTYCSNIVNVAGILSFDVIGFSNYSYGQGNDTAPLITSHTPNTTTILSESDLVLNFTTNFTDNENDYLNTDWKVFDVTVKNTTNITTSYDTLMNYSFNGEGNYVVTFNVSQMNNASLYDSIIWNITIEYPEIPTNVTLTNITGQIDLNVEEIEASLARIIFLIAGLVSIIMSFMIIGKTPQKAGAGLAILSVVFILMSGVGGGVMIGIIVILATLLLFADIYSTELLGV